MVIPNYSSRADYERMYAMGVSQYGQMTAGSYCYIGPQGIVHGTTITILNAGRKYLGIGLSGKSKESDNATITDVSSSPASSPTVETKEGDRLAGKVYLSSGLGGTSCCFILICSLPRTLWGILLDLISPHSHVSSGLRLFASQ